ncbi:MAG: hypothetical protein OJF49_004160 [Ktedonobacterales bacterium]|jgi:ATP-dependent protease HslVU (ClpYQ) peptidase subunit|nr:MAG: hypothetical protein OJF49_004160 [Ktedonobacterales bacterium]
MAVQRITVQLPEDLYHRLKREAEQAHRTIEERLVEVLAGATSDTPALPADLELMLAQLPALNDQELWHAARTHLSMRDAARLATLNRKSQRKGLESAEAEEQRRLLKNHERAMLVRAHAATLLKEHGHDVSALLTVK